MRVTPEWTEVANGILAIAQILAIVVAAAWAYFRFVRGRTFAERLETSVHVTPFRRGGISALRIRAGMTNTGASVVRLKDDVKIVYVYGTVVTDAAPGVSFGWGKHLVVASVFGKHKWIEAQETVNDEALVTVPDDGWLAFRVELIVASKKNKRWSCNAIVPATELEEWRREMHETYAEQDDLTPEEEKRIRQDCEEQERRDQEERERKQREAAT